MIILYSCQLYFSLNYHNFHLASKVLKIFYLHMYTGTFVSPLCFKITKLFLQTIVSSQ